ncbi:MAG TPA: hypothetical protein VF546_09430 [Pyrinomonadaceae bacterium]
MPAKPGGGADQPQTYWPEVSGVVPGETVPLPELPALDGTSVALGKLDGDYLLCGFISDKCYNCAQDSEFWRDLKGAAAQRRIAFYLINVASSSADPSSSRQFAAAMGFSDLPVLYDPRNEALNIFRVGATPQYVLLSTGGRVLARWDGVRHYDRRRAPEQMQEFFAYARD